MPLPKDISLARRQLNRLAKAHPEDRALAIREIANIRHRAKLGIKKSR